MHFLLCNDAIKIIISTLLFCRITAPMTQPTEADEQPMTAETPRPVPQSQGGRSPRHQLRYKDSVKAWDPANPPPCITWKGMTYTLKYRGKSTPASAANTTAAARARRAFGCWMTARCARRGPTATPTVAT